MPVVSRNLYKTHVMAGALSTYIDVFSAIATKPFDERLRVSVKLDTEYLSRVEVG